MTNASNAHCCDPEVAPAPNRPGHMTALIPARLLWMRFLALPVLPTLKLLSSSHSGCIIATVFFPAQCYTLSSRPVEAESPSSCLATWQ